MTFKTNLPIMVFIDFLICLTSKKKKANLPTYSPDSPRPSTSASTSPPAVLSPTSSLPSPSSTPGGVASSDMFQLVNNQELVATNFSRLEVDMGDTTTIEKDLAGLKARITLVECFPAERRECRVPLE